MRSAPKLGPAAMAPSLGIMVVYCLFLAIVGSAVGGVLVTARCR